MWSSVHTRGYTILLVVTLVFAVFTHHGRSTTRLVNVTTNEQRVACVTGQPCPPVRVVVNTVTVPAASDSQPEPERNPHHH